MRLLLPQYGILRERPGGPANGRDADDCSKCVERKRERRQLQSSHHFKECVKHSTIIFIYWQAQL